MSVRITTLKIFSALKKVLKPSARYPSTLEVPKAV